MSIILYICGSELYGTEEDPGLESEAATGICWQIGVCGVRYVGTLGSPIVGITGWGFCRSMIFSYTFLLASFLAALSQWVHPDADNMHACYHHHPMRQPSDTFASLQLDPLHFSCDFLILPEDSSDLASPSPSSTVPGGSLTLGNPRLGT